MTTDRNLPVVWCVWSAGWTRWCIKMHLMVWLSRLIAVICINLINARWIIMIKSSVNMRWTKTGSSISQWNMIIWIKFVRLLIVVIQLSNMINCWWSWDWNWRWMMIIVCAVIIIVIVMICKKVWFRMISIQMWWNLSVLWILAAIVTVWWFQSIIPQVKSLPWSESSVQFMKWWSSCRNFMPTFNHQWVNVWWTIFWTWK